MRTRFCYRRRRASLLVVRRAGVAGEACTLGRSGTGGRASGVPTNRSHLLATQRALWRWACASALAAASRVEEPSSGRQRAHRAAAPRERVVLWWPAVKMAGFHPPTLSSWKSEKQQQGAKLDLGALKSLVEERAPTHKAHVPLPNLHEKPETVCAPTTTATPRSEGPA